MCDPTLRLSSKDSEGATEEYPNSVPGSADLETKQCSESHTKARVL